MSISADLAARTLERLLRETGGDEINGADGGPYLSLVSPMAPDPVGSMRVFTGGRAAKTVYVGMTVPPIGLDSHMIFAFAEAGSPVPHFTLDSVEAGDMHAFHLDLVPRCDIGINPAYLDVAFAPLDGAYATGLETEGLTPAHLSRKQWAIMSPWMLANRATEGAMRAIGGTVDAYLDHWVELLSAGLSPDLCEMTPEQLAEHDRRHRAALFSPQVDPVWNQVDQLVGEETSGQIQEMLRTNDAPVVT